MIGKKWKEFRTSVANMRAVRVEFNEQEKNFGCLERNKNLVCTGDPCDNNGVEIPPCRKYELSVHCPDTTCPYREWNTKHYNTYLKLWNSGMDCFEAFLNLFVIKRRSSNNK